MTTKSVMLIWKGWSWSMHTIETETLLPSDLPTEFEARHSSYPKDDPSRFVLAGNCGDLPLYKQV